MSDEDLEEGDMFSQYPGGDKLESPDQPPHAREEQKQETSNSPEKMSKARKKGRGRSKLREQLNSKKFRLSFRVQKPEWSS